MTTAHFPEDNPNFADMIERRVAWTRLEVAALSPDPEARAMALAAAVADGEIRPLPDHDRLPARDEPDDEPDDGCGCGHPECGAC